MSDLKKPRRGGACVDVVVIHDPANREDEVEFCESEAAAEGRARDVLADAKSNGYAVDVYVCVARLTGSVSK